MVFINSFKIITQHSFSQDLYILWSQTWWTQCPFLDNDMGRSLNSSGALLEQVCAAHNFDLFFVLLYSYGSKLIPQMCSPNNRLPGGGGGSTHATDSFSVPRGLLYVCRLLWL